MKIKVLHIVLSLETGGLENGIVNLCNYSDGTRFDIDVLCLRAKGELSDRITSKHSKVYFDGDSDPSIYKAIKKIVKHCKQHQYDVIHTHGFTTMLTGYIAGRMVGTPLIINGEHGTFYADSFKKRTLQRMLFRLMDLNLSVSAELKNSILNAFSIKKDNFKPILNGVDIEKFKPTPDKENVKTQFGLPKRSKVIGYVGRLISGKDVPTLVQAAKKLVNEDQSFHFLIVGDGPERNTIETLINDLDLNHHVHMLGRRDDVPSCLQAMDVFCLPSLSEGLSNTLLEAMATGVPCVACNVGGNPEIVIPEVTGELVPTKSPECLYEALSHLTQCDASLKNMAASTRQHIEDNHSIESMVNEYQDTYTYQLNNKLGRVPQSVEANT